MLIKRVKFKDFSISLICEEINSGSSWMHSRRRFWLYFSWSSLFFLLFLVIDLLSLLDVYLMSNSNSLNFIHFELISKLCLILHSMNPSLNAPKTSHDDMKPIATAICHKTTEQYNWKPNCEWKMLVVRRLILRILNTVFINTEIITAKHVGITFIAILAI